MRSIAEQGAKCMCCHHYHYSYGFWEKLFCFLPMITNGILIFNIVKGKYLNK